MIWTEEERAVWAPPEDLTVSEWADRYRILPPGQSAEPGAWRTDRTPYLRAIMDCMGDPYTQEIDLMKAPQVGGSEGLRCAQGYWIDQDPGPCLIVFPSEAAARENLDERVVPMIRSTPRLARHLTAVARDIKMSQVALKTMTLYAGHAGSPQALATRPCRYGVCDETDKYPAYVGRETAPIPLVDARTRTYAARRKLVKISTPTTWDGPIGLAWKESANRYRFYLPCPRCGTKTALPFEGFDWLEGGRRLPDNDDRYRLADELEAGRAKCWFNCTRCTYRITEADRGEQLIRGEWLDDKLQVLDVKSIRKSFHVPSMISPWVSWGRLCAEYLRTRSTPAGLMAFANQWEGLPFEERVARVSIEDMRLKRCTGVRSTLPPWGQVVIVTADAGGDHVWWVARAWCPGYRSRLIDYGRAYGFEALREATLNRVWAFDDNRKAPLNTAMMLIDSGGTRTIDSGSRTDEVYKFSLTDSRIAPLKGDVRATGFAGKPIVTRRITYSPPGAEPYDVVLNLVNVGFYKDVLANRLQEKLADGASLWEELPNVDEDYLAQLASEHRVVERKGAQLVARWKPVGTTMNHFWDCSVYQCAAADMLRLDLAGPLEPVSSQVEEQPTSLPLPPSNPSGHGISSLVRGGRPWLISRR